MAFDATDLASVEEAMVNLATGAHEVEITIRNKKVRYAETDLDQLEKLRGLIEADLGTIYSRAYAKNGGRASC